MQTYSIALQSPFSFHLGCSYARKNKQKQQQQQKGLHFVCDNLLYAVSHVDAHMHAHDLPIIKAAPFILSMHLHYVMEPTHASTSEQYMSTAVQIQ